MMILSTVSILPSQVLASPSHTPIDQPLSSHHSFKTWLPIANRQYEQTIRREQREEEELQRKELQMEIEELERRQRVRANVRILMRRS